MLRHSIVFFFLCLLCACNNAHNQFFRAKPEYLSEDVAESQQNIPSKASIIGVKTTQVEACNVPTMCHNENAARLTKKKSHLLPPEHPQTNLISPYDDAHFRDSCMKFSNFSKCNPCDKYRTYDGSCNNLQHPSWGMSSSCVNRLMHPAYADGTSKLRLAKSGGKLPSPRDISLNIHSHLNNQSPYITLMLMQFGQFVAEEIVFSPLRSSDGSLLCCPVRDDNHPECAPIIIKSNDPFYSKFGVQCINNTRTDACSTCNSSGPRQQTNLITSFIDGSSVYGNNSEVSRSLRNDTDTALLKSQMSPGGDVLPPLKSEFPLRCSAPDVSRPCFESGDPRGDEHPALASLHIIFFRQHNNVVKILRTVNPGWNNDRLFEEARRIVAAQFQMVTYNEFLPLVLGETGMEMFDLSVKKEYTTYDPTVNPSILDEFSTAAFRFGHSLVDSFFYDATNHSNHFQTLRNLYFQTFGFYEKGYLEGIIEGLIRMPSQSFDSHMVPDVTDFLYRQPQLKYGLDLASLNVYRGLDHGIPPYVEMVRFCRGPKINSFKDLHGVFRLGSPQQFKNVYESVYDIDLFSGGLAEKPVPNGVVGPTFQCIIAKQFFRLKYGDRFYFEHGGQAGSFTPGQLNEIKKTLFARILCDNTRGIFSLPVNVMIKPSQGNPDIPCHRLPHPNFELWRD